MIGRQDGVGRFIFVRRPTGWRGDRQAGSEFGRKILSAGRVSSSRGGSPEGRAPPLPSAGGKFFQRPILAAPADPAPDWLARKRRFMFG